MIFLNTATQYKLKATIFALFAVAFALCFSSYAFAADVRLKSISKVQSDMLYLSDLFEGIRPGQDILLGRSPLPGGQISIEAPLLARLAKIYDLNWRAKSMSDRVIIRRPASIVSSQAIRDALRQRLIDNGVDTNFQMKLSGESPQITLPENMPNEFDIVSFIYDPVSDSFESQIVAPSRDDVHTTIDVFGRVERIIDVPVLKRSLRNGYVITLQDIDMVTMPIDSLNRDVVIDPAKLIGTTPDRFLLAKKPIRKSDIRPPQMIKRGQKIMIIHEQGPLTLSALGRSMETGSMGDLIRVVNMDSNKALTGEIIGDGLVAIR